MRGGPLQLASSIQRVVSQEGAEPPRLAKFFRGQMATIISRALNELDINPVPSRRCFTLLGGWKVLQTKQQMCTALTCVQTGVENAVLLLFRLAGRQA